MDLSSFVKVSPPQLSLQLRDASLQLRDAPLPLLTDLILLLQLNRQSYREVVHFHCLTSRPGRVLGCPFA